MRYFHGTKVRELEVLLPPSITGNVRESESTRKVGKDVVFITPDKGYAGVYGKVYEVIPNNPRPYFEYLLALGEERRAKRVLRAGHDIWVCDSAIVT